MRDWSCLVLSLAVWAFTGCASNDPPAVVQPDAGSGSGLQLSKITVDVSYGGAKAGALVIGAFRSVPPMGPPLAFQTVPMPAFPQRVTLQDLEPGTDYVIAVLDVAPASPTRPGPEDVQAASGPIDVSGSDVEVSLTLVER